MHYFPCCWFFIYFPDDSNSLTRGMKFRKFEVSVSVFRYLVYFAWNDILTSSLRILVVWPFLLTACQSLSPFVIEIHCTNFRCWVEHIHGWNWFSCSIRRVFMSQMLNLTNFYFIWFAPILNMNVIRYHWNENFMTF